MSSPAFQVYVNDFLGSAKVGMMTTEEVGAYWLLLLLEWQGSGFVFDRLDLARWCRLTPERFDEVWIRIGPCFRERNQKLHNVRLSKERAKQKKWRDKSREGGIKSGRARSKGLKGGATTLEPTPQPKTNTPLPLPLPSPELQLQQPKTKTSARRKPRGEAGVARETWLTPFAAVWNQHLTPGRFPYGRASAPLKSLLDLGHTTEEIAYRLGCFFERHGVPYPKIPPLPTDKAEWFPSTISTNFNAFADDFDGFNGRAKYPDPLRQDSAA